MAADLRRRPPVYKDRVGLLARPPRASQAADRTTGNQRLMTYPEFWHRYLRAHRDPRTRALHYLGTSLALCALAAAAATRDWRWLVAAPVVGYAAAWAGHVMFEHNRPETFGHPLWSLISDFRMLGLFATGRLTAEMHAAGVGGR